MARIHDWRRKFWTNRNGDRTYNPDELEVDDDILAIYENGDGHRVSYGYADEEAEHNYEVYLDGEVPEDIPLGGEGEDFNFDGSELEALHFGTRAEAREAASDLQRMLPTLEADEDGEYEYSSLQSWAKVIGVSANKGREELTETIVGAEQEA